MDAKILNQFINATAEVFQSVASVELKKEKVNFYQEGHKFQCRIATIIGFTGALKGQIVVSIDDSIAMKFASAILMGVPVETYNEMAESGVCEMANMIGGASLRLLAEIGYICELSVPSIVRGESIELGFLPRTPIFAIDYSSSWGPVAIIMRVEEPKQPS